MKLRHLSLNSLNCGIESTVIYTLITVAVVMLVSEKKTFHFKEAIRSSFFEPKNK